MSHPDEVSTHVDTAIEESITTRMDELLIELSDDIALSREGCYTQQQCLRTTVAHHGRQYREDTEARRGQLIKDGTIF